MGASLELSEAIPLPDRIGQYTILCQLDQGGMATLFLGRAAGLGGFERLFAIKLIHEHLSREKRFVDMFLDEARLAARIVHPNVVSVYEVGVDRGRHFIAMDYINGETLSLALQHTWGQKQTFPVELAAYLIAQAAEGLHAAHELKGADGQTLGVVHRDVAPSNLMLGYDGILRVMDFGVAKARDQVTQTRPGTIKGTLAYMAPEHVRSRSLDRRADVWSLGVVLWETLVGKRLFKGRNDVETSERLLRRKVLAPGQLRDGLAPAIDDVVLRALQREPERRFATTREFGEALQEYLAESKLRIGPSDVEAFMQTTFEERHAWRQEIQQRAPTATAKEFRVFEGLIDEPMSDSDLEIDLLAEAAMEEIVEESPAPEPSTSPLEEPESAAARLAAELEAEFGSIPVVGLTETERVARDREATMVIRAERALARARNERADKVSDGRIFLFQWREKADQSVELILRETRDHRKLIVAGVAVIAVLILGVITWKGGPPVEPQFETLKAETAEPTAVPPEPTAAKEAQVPEPAPEPSGEIAPPVTKPVEHAPESEPAVFELRFEIQPDSTQLTVDGRPQDPAERLTLDAGQRVLVEATAAGYQPFEQTVTLSGDQVVRIELSPTEPETAKPKNSRKPRSSGRKKSDLLLFEGDDL